MRDSLAIACKLETDPVRIRREPALRCVKPCKEAWAKACGVGTGVLDNAPGAVCSVACLEWQMRIGESLVSVMAMTKAGLLLKYFLQKRLRDGLTVVENT